MALTEAELAQRRGLITSSNVAACLGLDTRCTPLQAALRARGESDEPRNAVLEKACERGDRLESLCLDSIAEPRGWTWRKPPFVQRDDAPWAGDSCDAMYYDEQGRVAALGEAKTAALGVSRHFGAEQSDDVPHTALLQSQWHLWHHPTAEVCYVPVLVGGYRFEFREYIVPRKPQLIDVMTQELHEFHRRYVVGDELPPVSADDGEWLLRKWPDASAGMVTATPELESLVRAKAASGAALKAAKADDDLAKNRIREYLADGEGARAEWGSVYYRRVKGSAKTDWQRVANELASGDVPEDIVMRHTRIAPGPRVLRVYLKEGETNE